MKNHLQNTGTHLRIIGFLMLLASFSNSYSSGNNIKVTYLNNCSFLYECAGKKVIVDPFGTDFGDFFYLTSDDTQKRIIKGEAPFDNLDVLLITHIHGDHFNFNRTEEFLGHNPKITMICPPQIYKLMHDSCSNFERIKKRIIHPEIKIGTAFDLRIRNIDIKVIRMQHGTDRNLEGLNWSEYTDYEKTENFGYVIKIKGKTIFHQGDGCLNINNAALSLIDKPVDVAHLSYFDWDTSSYNLLKETLYAENIIFMHGTKPAKEFEKEQFKAVIPELIIFKKELESRIFK